MSFDSRMFAQAQQCLATVQKHSQQPMDVCVVGINLSPLETAWLTENKVTVFTDLTRIPSYADAPAYACSMTCRPLLRELFPGYEIYLWVDADIRFAHGDAFDFYLQSAAAAPDSIVISQEVDTTYAFVSDPKTTTIFHRITSQRLLEIYGRDIANLLAFSLCYNCGIFAMHHESKVWSLYLQNLRKAMETPFHHMKEQDAMNVAIVQSGVRARNAPTIMNWLCSISFPLFATDLNRWVRPEFPHLPISVLHLTGSNKQAMPGMTYYELYKQRGLTE